MRILCLNANRSAARLSGHAAGHEADIVVLQEWADHREDRSATASEALGGLGSVEATRYLATASADDMAVAHSSDRVLVTRHPQGMVVNTYLPSDGRAGSRAEHLKGLSELLSSLGERPVVVAGDFNMAPRPEDGWYGRNHSKYTKEVERAALQALLGEHGLTDLGAGQRWEATFERMNRGKLTSFRCDLALVRQEDSTEWSLAYDHRYRLDDGMSDHSALVLDIGGG